MPQCESYSGCSVLRRLGYAAAGGLLRRRPNVTAFRLTRSVFGSLMLPIVLVSMMLAARAGTQSSAPLMRYPNAHGQRIVFVAAGDLWLVRATGGTARRLTDDAGMDIMPRFSPDGRWIAYTATAPGNQDVYVIPSGGGTPRRLTFRSNATGPGTTHGPQDNVVATWTPDSRYVVFLSLQGGWNSSDYRAYRVPVGGGLPPPLPPNRSGLLTFGASESAIAFTRALTDFLTQKRYDGGLAQSICTYDFRTSQLQTIAAGRGSSTDPMWYQRKIYFVSERDDRRRANIWVYDEETRQTREVTHFGDFDVDIPSLGGDAITFQQGGRLFRLSLPAERLAPIAIDVPDDGKRTKPRAVPAQLAVRDTDAITQTVDFAVSPHGEAAVFAARGTLFSVEAGGATRELTQTVAVANDHPAFSADGRFLAYTTDAGGESHVAIRPASGGAERSLAALPPSQLFAPVWSPDGSLIAVPDIEHDLWLLRTAGHAPPVRVAVDPGATILDARFSPDGGWLAYSTLRHTQLRALHLYSIARGQDTVVSDPFNDDRSPEFSPDGRFLYFVSSRSPAPFVSETNGLDLAAIASDGVSVATRAARKPSAGDPMRVDLAGLMRRAVPLPIEPGDVGTLAARGERLYYDTRPPALILGALPGETSRLHVYDSDSRTDTVLIDGLDAYAVSGDGSSVLYARDGRHAVIDTAAGTRTPRPLDLSTLRVRIDPRGEWTAMFEQAWRIERDAFVDRATGGVDWRSVHDAYRAAFLPRLRSRDDLTYVIGQMLGELGSSHTFVGPGDDGDTRQRTGTARLGVDYTLDVRTGRYRLAKIYRGDVSRPEYRSPLEAPGLAVHEGDYLLAIAGHELIAPMNPDSLLAGVTGSVVLTIAPSATAPRRTIVVSPVTSEFGLRKASWIVANRALVARLSANRVGYVYLQDFFDAGARDFFRQFYAQTDKAGLVIDVRWNNGGFTSQFILDALHRTAAGTFVNREGASSDLPPGVFAGPKAVVVNEYSSSDGDQFPYFFRAAGLGPVIGMRTWGGVRGLDGRWPLLDGGYVTAPKDALHGLDGTAIIENHGVSPDIRIVDSPDEIETGTDAQLTAAVHYIVTQLRRTSKASGVR